jgi:hypothetical protein
MGNDRCSGAVWGFRDQCHATTAKFMEKRLYRLAAAVDFNMNFERVPSVFVGKPSSFGAGISFAEVLRR